MSPLSDCRKGVRRGSITGVPKSLYFLFGRSGLSDLLVFPVTGSIRREIVFSANHVFVSDFPQWFVRRSDFYVKFSL